MKKLILSSILGLLFCNSAVFAQFEMVHCSSTLGTDHDLSLVIVNSSLREIRMSSLESSNAKALIPRKIMNQSTSEKSLYKIVGSDVLVEMENKILNGEAGRLRIDDEDFNCSL